MFALNQISCVATMKCKHCEFEGRGSRGFFKSGVKGEHWKCPKCNGWTKLEHFRKPAIKGFCKDCDLSFYPTHPNTKNDLMCKFFEASDGGAFVETTDYCSNFKKNTDQNLRGS